MFINMLCPNRAELPKETGTVRIEYRPQASGYKPGALPCYKSL